MENQHPMASWFEEHGRRKTVKWIAILLMALTAFLVMKTLNEIRAYKFIGKSDAFQNVITVSGKGEIIALPDIATFSFSVREEGATVKAAQALATKKINEALAYLKKEKVADRDIKTIGYNIYPRYEYDQSKVKGVYPYPPGERYLVAYEVSQTLSVKVRKIEEAGALLSGIGEIGVSEMSGLSFANDKEDELRKEARELAIKDARRDANMLADNLGVSIVRILNFSESGNYPGPIFYAKAEIGGGRGGDAPPAPEVPAGENTITSNVTITFEIR